MHLNVWKTSETFVGLSWPHRTKSCTLKYLDEYDTISLAKWLTYIFSVFTKKYLLKCWKHDYTTFFLSFIESYNWLLYIFYQSLLSRVVWMCKGPADIWRFKPVAERKLMGWNSSASSLHRGSKHRSCGFLIKSGSCFD